MEITVSHRQYLENLKNPKAPESVEQCLGRHVARTHGFESRLWSDEALKRITSETDARFLYEQSATLQKEFSHCECFLAYWRNLARIKLRRFHK